MTTLTQLRTVMSTFPYFGRSQPGIGSKSSVLPTLSSQGNAIAGAVTRVGVGVLLNPFSVLKARFEVRYVVYLIIFLIYHLATQSDIHAYKSLSGAFISIVRSGPSELLRGVVASSLRDAPYAGLFVVLYEGLKHQACTISLHVPRSRHPFLLMS